MKVTETFIPALIDDNTMLGYFNAEFGLPEEQQITDPAYSGMGDLSLRSDGKAF